MQALCQFDEFRRILSTRLNAELIMHGVGDNPVHSLTEPDYECFEASRNEVTFTLLSAPDPLVAFNCQNTELPGDQAFLVLPLNEVDFYFNSIKLNAQQVGLTTHRSGAPLSVCAAAHCLWLVVSFTTYSRHLNLVSATNMPITLHSERMHSLRTAINHFLLAGQSTGTPILDQVHLLLKELESTPPPLRPQKNTGRSRLPRKHLVPSVIKVIRHHSSSAPFVNPVAEQLGVTPHSIIKMFKEVTGMSPKRYWLLRKLYLFRDALLSGDYVSVSDAAYSLDMNDLGRMSARYRKLFGEFPSETLIKRS